MQLLFIIVQYLIPQHALSRLVAKIADCQVPWVKNTFIEWFHRRYQVDMSEALESDPTLYPSFNAFFTRALKPDARPLEGGDETVVSPADGAISQMGTITDGRILQAKGQTFSTLELLGGDSLLAQRFDGGSFATIYLAPRDYHRVHMPVAGTLRQMTYVPGQLFSVNQTTAANVPRLFARNERLICLFDTDCGPVAVVMVGAMIVAGIETTWAGQVAPPPRSVATLRYGELLAPVHLGRGEELGRFKLGSTVILLFARDALRWSGHLGPGSVLRMGRAIGVRT